LGLQDSPGKILQNFFVGASLEMAADNYTTDELNALKGIFSLYDPDKTGVISGRELEVCSCLLFAFLP
jgi:Ca2+-binding EF-hand superfamily protein